MENLENGHLEEGKERNSRRVSKRIIFYVNDVGFTVEKE